MTSAGDIRSVASGTASTSRPHVVVVMGIGGTFELGDPQRHQIGGRCGVEESPDRERDAQIVDHRCPPVQRCPAHPDRRATGDGVVRPLGVGQHELRTQPCGQAQRVALVGALEAEARPSRLAPGEFAWAIGGPPSGT